MPDIFDDIAPDKVVSGGDIFDEVALEPVVSKPRSLWNSLVRGIKSAQAIPDVAVAAGTANMGKPSIRQERKAFVASMSDPQYQQKLMEAGDDPTKLRMVEETRGPAAKLEQVMRPAKSLQIETARDLAATQADIQAIPQSPAQQRLAMAKTSREKWGVWLRDPVELTAGIVLESLPPSIAGATLGTVVGGPGAGTAAGAGASSAAMTFASEFLGAANQQGVDIANPAALETFLNDRKMFAAAFNTALTKSAIVGGVDAGTAGLAGRWIEPALKQGLRQRIVASGKELAMQMAGGAGGEAAGQALSGQQLDPFDIAMEALAEVASAPGEVAGNLMAKHDGVNVAQKVENPVASAEPDIFDQVQAETISQSQSPVVPQPSDTGLVKQTPAAVSATSPVAGASLDQQAQVRKALEALPGADKDLMRKVPALTTEQTDAGLREDNIPATKADLAALANFIQNGGPNPFAGASPKTDTPGVAQTGATTNDGDLAPISKGGDNNEQTQNQRPRQEVLADRPSGETVAAAGGQPTLPPVSANVESSTQQLAPNKPTFSVGQKVAVRLSGRGGKEYLARITQLQPDGSAQVQIEGEKVQRWVKPHQFLLTNTDWARASKQEELASLPAEQQTKVKADAAEFAQIVEDYAPQLDWAPGEAYDRNTVMQEQGVENARLRNAAIDTAMRKVFPEGQGNSVIDRARALPKLVEYLKQQFPGDNSIAKRRALEEFGRSETSPEQTATVERDQAILKELATRYPGKSHLQGLRAVGRSTARGQSKLDGQSGGKSIGKGALPTAGASAVTELERIFGVRIIFVQDATFAGIKPAGVKLILINAKAKAPMMALAGHELLHHIASTHPGLYADFKREAAALLKNNEQFRAELARKGYADLTDDVVTEEMFADVLGDAVLDPAFLKQLAKSEPNLFKRFARTAVKWLEKLIAKAKALGGFDSAQYVTDMEAMRHELLNLLRDAGRQTQFEKAGIQQEATENTAQGQDAFARQRIKFSNATITAPGLVDLGDRFSLTAYHGTPHKVDKFTTAKIGTGEGAQVYGWGLYFAENEKVAEDYKKNLTEREFISKVRELYDEFSTPEDALTAINDPENKFSEGQRRLLAALQKEDWLGFDYPHQAVQAAIREPENVLVDAPETRAALNTFGNKYTVELNVEPEELLDWDKPLSEQSSKVIRAIAPIVERMRADMKRLLMPEKFEGWNSRVESMDINTIYTWLSRENGIPIQETGSWTSVTSQMFRGDEMVGKDENASKHLAALGIKGIRFLDQGSRNRSHGTHSGIGIDGEKVTWETPPPTYNYVIFSDNDITITHENGKEVGARDMFSMEGGDLFGSPESVEEQRARLKAEAKTQKLKKAKEAMQERAGARLIGKDLDTTQEMFGAEVKRDKSGQGDMFSREAGPLWRSNIQGALESWQNKGTPEQLRAHLAKTKGAMDEAEWIGLDEWLATTGNSVTKQQVQEFVKANTVDVQEVTKDSKKGFSEFSDKPETKFSQYQLPGGENYRELLLTLPEGTESIAENVAHNAKLDTNETRQEIQRLQRAKNENENSRRRLKSEIDTLQRFKDLGEERESPVVQRLPGIKTLLGLEADKSFMPAWQPEEGSALTENSWPQRAIIVNPELSRLERQFADTLTRRREIEAEIGKLTTKLPETKKLPTFASPHFDEPNILAHVRFNERTDADGKRVLFIEEVQSDWHQKGRKEGYNTQPDTTGWKANFRQRNDSNNTYEIWRANGTRAGLHEGATPEAAITAAATADSRHSSVPDAPFKQTWPMLAMKRMIRYASENGFDRIAWTTGEQQAERYDLSKQVDHILYGKHDQGMFLAVYGKNGEVVYKDNNQNPAKIEDVIGKELAQKIAANDGERPSGYPDNYRKLSGDNLKVGGEGMKGFYDRILPGEVNKFVKKWGGRVGKTKLDNSEIYKRWRAGEDFEQEILPQIPVHSLDITPAMKGAALEGFDMFSKPDPAKQSEFTKLQEDIATAEAELLKAIRQHMNPPQGMRKAEALEAKNAAATKLNRLIAQQIKLMTSANVDAARSPEQTAEMIGQTVDLLNSIQDEISERTAKSQEVPADLTKVRQDLQTRLNLLKGWSNDQADTAALGARPEVEPKRDSRMVEFESATNPSGDTMGEWWQKLQNGLRYLTSPIPELPLRGEQARKSALFRRGYRLFAVENDRVQKEAAEKVRQVVEPLTKLGRNPQDNAALKQYFRLGEALQRDKMDDAKSKQIRAKMAEVEKQLNRDPFNLFRRLVLYRDLWWRGTYLKNEDGKPITLPMGLTVDDVRGELRRLTESISQHKDGLAITEALRRHYALTDELQKSILAHGEIIPESLRNPLYFPHHMVDSWRDSVARVKPTTEEDFRKYLITPQGSDKLIQTDYLKAIFLHTADVLAHNARLDLVDKYWKPYDISEQLKAQHGENWNRAYNIPAGYKLFTPYNKLPLRMDYILSREVLADKLGVLFNDGDLRDRMGEVGKVLKVKPEDLHAALVAGEKIQWVLPAEIADALNGIAKREAAAVNPGLGHAIGLPFRKLNSFWKGTKLFAPWNWIRYEYGNLSTDAIDKVLAADPGAAKYLSRAAREVWKSGDKDFKATPEFAAAQREGVFDTVTAGEAGKLLELPAFKEFLSPGEKNLATVKNIFGGPARGSKFREATFRYANFLANVERLRAGKEPVYSGAFHGDIEALGEDVDGQRRMLEGDELTYAKAAEISLKTFGDYNSLSQASQWLRQYAVPFWSWQDVNFRYHANQLRNLADGMIGKAGDVGTARKAALRYAGIRVVSTLVAVGLAKELWNQFGGPLLGLWDDDDDLESKLSAQDRRRGHILLGKDDKGQAMVVYTPSAWSDVAEWIGGQNMKRLMLEWARGQITLDQVAKDYAKQLPADTLNKISGSLGPLIKGFYEASSGKSTFPDITDQRSIPPSEKWWRFVSTMTDDRIVNSLRAAFDKDYYSQPATEQLQQVILQIRRRDPEQWAYYEAREDASDWKEAKTGKRHEAGAYDAPEAMALRNFRKAIYRGDVANAERFYSRLLEFGYTAERLDASIRSQHPLADLNESERAEYIKTLTPKQRQELELATKYYSRIKALDGREKQLFPKKGQKANPNPDLLKRIVEQQSQKR